MSVRWLDRCLIQTPYLTLCLSENEFAAVCRHCNLDKPWPRWVSDGADATQHEFENAEGCMVCVVCLRGGGSLADAVALLAHEAVHVWWNVADAYPGLGRKNEELAAVAVQMITLRLVKEWRKRCSTKRRFKRKPA